jgi:chromatin segregation and condensation protein Rec8/ScpA/Scc1 (kleisin family)
VERDVVLRPPEERERRDHDEDLPAGSDDAAELADPAGVVVEVLEKVEGDREVEAPGAERQLDGVRLAERPELEPVSELEGIGRAIDVNRLAEAREQLRVRAAAAPEVQDTRPTLASRDERREQSIEETSTPAIPPVRALDVLLDEEPLPVDIRRARGGDYFLAAAILLSLRWRRLFRRATVFLWSV